MVSTFLHVVGQWKWDLLVLLLVLLAVWAMSYRNGATELRNLIDKGRDDDETEPPDRPGDPADGQQ